MIVRSALGAHITNGACWRFLLLERVMTDDRRGVPMARCR